MAMKINDQQTRLLSGIKQYHGEESLSDVTLVAEGREFPCSRLVLAASSEYFRAMFTSQVKERQVDRIELHEVDVESLSAILKYIYTGEIQISESNVQNLYMTSNKLELLPLVHLCSEFITLEISIDNCIDLYYFAAVHVDLDMQMLAFRFIEQNFVEVARHCDFDIKIDHVLLEKLLRSDQLNVECEETVFNALMAWVAFDVKTRSTVLKTFFKLIRIPLLDEHTLRHIVVNHTLVSNDLACINHVSSYFTFMKLSQNPKQVLEKVDKDFLDNLKMYSTLRCGMHTKKLIVFSGGSNSPTTRSFSCFDPLTRQNYLGVSSYPSFDFKFRIDFFKMVTVKQRFVYFLGGVLYENHHFDEKGETFKSMYIFDSQSLKWVEKEPMKFRRCAFAACVHGNDIYVMGGKSTYPQGEPMDNMEVYDTSDDTWSHLKPMPMNICHHSATVHSGAIFVFGGSDVMCDFVDTVFRYDLELSDWAIVRTNLMRPRAELTAISIDDKIYILGGAHTHDNALSVEIYEPEHNRWQYGSDFPDERKFTCVTALDNVIYVCGGVRLFVRRGRGTRQVETKDMYSYTPSMDKWSKVARTVQYPNISTCTAAKVNCSIVKESDFVSPVGDDTSVKPS